MQKSKCLPSSQCAQRSSPMRNVDRLRELQDLSNPAAPFNQPDAEYCPIHNCEMTSFDQEDEDGWNYVSICEMCQGEL